MKRNAEIGLFTKPSNLKHIGTIGLLLRAKKQGIIQHIKPYVQALPENGIYVRKELIDTVLKEANE
ncbi:hypothetical protein JCM14469_09600 [Desulfatiferula olefinivorans]